MLKLGTVPTEDADRAAERYRSQAPVREHLDVTGKNASHGKMTDIRRG